MFYLKMKSDVPSTAYEKARGGRVCCEKARGTRTRRELMGRELAPGDCIPDSKAGL